MAILTTDQNPGPHVPPRNLEFGRLRGAWALAERMSHKSIQVAVLRRHAEPLPWRQTKAFRPGHRSRQLAGGASRTDWPSIRTRSKPGSPVPSGAG